MTNINSLVPQQAQSAYSAKGFSGLVSGMNTEEVVEKMTLNIQNRIDRISKEETKNTWKQEAYREVINSVTSFQEKYFSYSNPETNLLRTGLYHNLKRTPKGANADKVRVTSNNGKGEANFEVSSITQLAKRASYVGSTGIDSSTITTGKLNFNDITVNLVADKAIEVMYDGKRYMVDISGNTYIKPGEEAATLAQIMNEAMAKITVIGTADQKLHKSIVFKASEDGKRLQLEAVDPKDKKKFSISGGQNETLNALGLQKDVEGSGNTPILGIQDVKIIEKRKQSLAGREIRFDLNGQVKRLQFDETDNDLIKDLPDNNAKTEKIAEIMNNKLAALFGSGKINVTANEGKLSFKAVDSTATLVISSPNSDTLGSGGMFPISDNTNNRLDMNERIGNLGITPTLESTEAGATAMDHIYKINVNGREFSFQGRATIAQVIKAINDDKEAGVDISYLATTNKFSIMADEFGENGKLEFHDVGSGSFAKTLFGRIADEAVAYEDKGINKGQDLKMKIKYRGEPTEIEIVRNSNIVNIDNMGIEAKATFTAANESENVSFTTEINTEEAVKAIKEMVTDYNKMIEQVNKLVTTKRAGFKNKKLTDRFEPLTDRQRKEMTAKEIEDWEAKAKEGILFADPSLRGLLGDLRFVFSTPVGIYGFGKDIGLSTASSYSGNGKLILDEAKLKEALSKDAEKVMNLFNAGEADNVNNTDPKLAGGFAIRAKKILESYARAVGQEKGRLVNIAGIKGNATTRDNLIDRQNALLAKKREALEVKLKETRERYQKRFTMLERYMAKMQQQSSWLAGQ